MHRNHTRWSKYSFRCVRAIGNTVLFCKQAAWIHKGFSEPFKKVVKGLIRCIHEWSVSSAGLVQWFWNKPSLCDFSMVSKLEKIDKKFSNLKISKLAWIFTFKLYPWRLNETSKPVAQHLNLLNHSYKHMAVCGISLHRCNTGSRKNSDQKFIFQISTLNPHGINDPFFIWLIYFCFPHYHAPTILTTYKQFLDSLWRRTAKLSYQLCRSVNWGKFSHSQKRFLGSRGLTFLNVTLFAKITKKHEKRFWVSITLQKFIEHQ